jgi:hypothetical protein
VEVVKLYSLDLSTRSSGKVHSDQLQAEELGFDSPKINPICKEVRA